MTQNKLNELTTAQEIQMLIHELLKQKIEGKLVDLLRKLYGKNEEEELDELSSDVLNRYMDRATRQVRKGTYAFDKIKTQVKKRQNRLVGMKRANDRINKKAEEHNDDQLRSEGLGGAFKHLARHTAAQTLAKGLGVRPSLVHAFVSHLAQRKKETAAQRQAKPKGQPKPKAVRDPNANLRAFFAAERRRKEGTRFL